MPPMLPADALSNDPPAQLTREVFGNVPGWAVYAFYLLAAIAVGIWLYGIVRRIQLWRKGRREGEGINWQMAIGRLIRDVVLQRRVWGRGFASVAHVLLFSGF